jgi:hypothetical protein
MEGDNAKKFGFSIDLPIRNEWKSVDLMRTSVQNCFAALFREVDGSHAVSMVTGELLENAMKYGDWKGATGDDQVFRMNLSGDADKALITVSSPVEPDSDNVRKLFETIEWIQSHERPEDAYRARLLEIAKQRQGTFNRLGLVRVAYEGGGIITAKVDGKSVTVIVEIRL